MIERKEEVKVYVTQAICGDDCDTVIVPTGVMLPVHPPLYEHRCPACYKRHNLSALYPLTTYEKD